MSNTGTIVAPSGRRSWRCGQNHCSYDKIRLTYLFIPPPVTSSHHWVDIFLSLIEFVYWRIWHMFLECSLLNGELNAFDRIVVKETCLIIVAKVVWIGKTILTHFARFWRDDPCHVEHLFQPFEWFVGWSEVADSCHRRVPEKVIDSSFAQVVLDSPVGWSILLIATKRRP